MEKLYTQILRIYRVFCTKTLKKMKGSIKTRSNPAVMKINSPEFKSIFNNELNDLIDLFKKYNYELRIAGGAVRDILSEIPPKDIDLATTATPDEMKTMFTNENIRMINMKGEKHGTITPRINDKENFEVTTLRIDMVTDGRHAEIKYTKDWQVDANRRDLTINSMFLGFDGTVYDYFYGYEDLKQRRVVFVGDPDTRIKEDFLRILRYFRFYGRIAEKADQHDSHTIESIKENISGLQRISGERIWGELKKIIDGNFGLELTIEMINCGIAKYIGLPENPNMEEFHRVVEFSKKFKDRLYPISYLTALLATREDASKLHERLKLTAFERDLAIFLTKSRDLVKKQELATLNDFQKLCIAPYFKKEFAEELLKYSGKDDMYSKLKEWKIPPFPLNGALLRKHNCPPGITIGIVLKKLKLIWANDDFKTSTEDLLGNHLKRAIQESLPEQKEPLTESEVLTKKSKLK